MPGFSVATIADRQGIVTASSALVHRFEETINGRRYAIEVGPALGDRWRAYLVRAAGGPTALMPFYGATPEEALTRLTTWLLEVHRVTADSV